MNRDGFPANKASLGSSRHMKVIIKVGCEVAVQKSIDASLVKPTSFSVKTLNETTEVTATSHASHEESKDFRKDLPKLSTIPDKVKLRTRGKSSSSLACPGEPFMELPPRKRRRRTPKDKSMDIKPLVVPEDLSFEHVLEILRGSISCIEDLNKTTQELCDSINFYPKDCHNLESIDISFVRTHFGNKSNECELGGEDSFLRSKPVEEERGFKQSQPKISELEHPGDGVGSSNPNRQRPLDSDYLSLVNEVVLTMMAKERSPNVPAVHQVGTSSPGCPTEKERFLNTLGIAKARPIPQVKEPTQCRSDKENLKKLTWGYSPDGMGYNRPVLTELQVANGPRNLKPLSPPNRNLNVVECSMRQRASVPSNHLAHQRIQEIKRIPVRGYAAGNDDPRIKMMIPGKPNMERSF